MSVGYLEDEIKRLNAELVKKIGIPPEKEEAEKTEINETAKNKTTPEIQQREVQSKNKKLTETQNYLHQRASLVMQQIQNDGCNFLKKSESTDVVQEVTRKIKG